MAQGQGHTVKSIAPVAFGSDVQARLFTLAPGETIPWRFHRRTADELGGECKVHHLCVYINADRSG
jgi:quercetin dioxygenase-like cupin family protein